MASHNRQPKLSPRAPRPGIPVSMPVSWEELPKLTSAAQWNIANAIEHLSGRKRDPWTRYWNSRQDLTPAIRTLEYKPV